MGREAECHARFGKQSGTGKVLLETSEVIFRGPFRVKVPLAAISAVTAARGVLTLRWPEGMLALELGDAAAKWADAIRNPKSVVEKLGVKPGHKVAALGRHAQEFLAELAAAAGAPVAKRASKGCDHVFLALSSPADQARLAGLKPAIHPAGGIWAIYPRGRKDLSEDTVRAAGRRAGLTDIKVVRFSDTHGALRLVIPRAAR